MDDLTTFTSKINNIYVDTSSSFCLVIFGRTRFKFLYNRINFQINTDFCQLTQHGFIRCMRNNKHQHLKVLKNKHIKTVCLVLPQDLQIKRQKHMKLPFKNSCLALRKDLQTKQFMKWPFQSSLLSASTGLTNKNKTHEVTFNRRKTTNLATVLKMDWKFGLHTQKKKFCHDSKLWIFLWCLRASEFRKVLAQEGHANLTSKWSLHMHEQMAAYEVDGPSLHPQLSIYTPFWCPHIQTKGCHMGRDGYLQGWGDSQVGGLLCQSATLNYRSGGFRFHTFRLLRRQLRNGGCGGMVASFRQAWGRGHGGLWYGSHPLPLILPKLIVIFVVLLSPVTKPPLSVHWPSLVNAVSGKERKQGFCHKGQAEP